MDGWTVCIEHRGKHGMLQGRCVLVGAEVPRPTRWHARPVSCQTCDMEQDVVKLRDGRVLHVEAGTDRIHRHPPDQTAERMGAVATGLEALQETLAGLLLEQRQARRPEGQPLPQAPPEPPRPAARSREQEIPTVTIWSPGSDDGSGA